MGAFYNGRCHESAAEAATIEYSSIPAVVLSANPLVVVRAENVGGVWVHDVYENGVVVASVAAPVEYLSCDPAASVADGAALGFAVVAVWVAAYAVRVIARSVFR